MAQGNTLEQEITSQNKASIKYISTSRKNSQWDSAGEWLQTIFLSGIVALLLLGSFKTGLCDALNLTDPEFLVSHHEWFFFKKQVNQDSFLKVSSGPSHLALLECMGSGPVPGSALQPRPQPGCQTLYREVLASRLDSPATSRWKDMNFPGLQHSSCSRCLILASWMAIPRRSSSGTHLHGHIGTTDKRRAFL